jgi:hypothetical protein
VPAQRLGQGDGVGAEILVHWEVVRRAFAAAAGSARDGGARLGGGGQAILKI